jgi:hypothetical protein
MFPQRVVIVIALIVSPLPCLAQRHQARDAGVPQSNSAPARSDSGLGRTPSNASPPSQPASPSLSGTARVDSSSRSDSRTGHSLDVGRDRSSGRDDASHLKRDVSKGREKEPPVAGAEQRSVRPERPLPTLTEQSKKLAEECRKMHAILYNGVCVESIPAAQGYWQQRKDQGFTPCDNSVKRARIAALQSQVTRACGPQGNVIECDAAKKELARILSLPGCSM